MKISKGQVFLIERSIETVDIPDCGHSCVFIVLDVVSSQNNLHKEKVQLLSSQNPECIKCFKQCRYCNLLSNKIQAKTHSATDIYPSFKLTSIYDPQDDLEDK